MARVLSGEYNLLLCDIHNGKSEFAVLVLQMQQPMMGAYGAPPVAAPPQPPPAMEVPNKILFVTDLPTDVANQDAEPMLRALFEQV